MCIGPRRSPPMRNGAPSSMATSAQGRVPSAVMAMRLPGSRFGSGAVMMWSAWIRGSTVITGADRVRWRPAGRAARRA